MPLPRDHDALICPLGLTSDQFVALCKSSLGIARPTSLEAYRRVFRDGLITFSPAAASLAPVETTLRDQSPEGEVIKFTQRVSGVARPDSPGLESLATESVLIPMIGRTRQNTYTLCVSSQVGCAMGCTFCETAQMGLIRSLTPAEIVGQWFAAATHFGIRPKNVVFMGMGEPLDNFDNVIQAIAVLKDHNGPHVPISNITVSTVGRVEGIRRLAEQIRHDGWHRLGLAISLNAPNDDIRSGLMPINRRWNMQELQAALIDWPRFAGNKICVEYVLIPGVNDQEQHASEVAAFLDPLRADDGIRPRAVLNLIPYNPRRASPWPAPEEAQVEQFMGWLGARGVFVKRRRTKGRSMYGACGQLGSEKIRQRRLVQPTISA
ncbi:MAG: radical SAM protein [Tepidisphaera sp.]|nr:radical SAM protein [Tepidisphaera sp.]